MKKLLFTLLLGCYALAGFSQVRFDAKVGILMANVNANKATTMKTGYALGVGMDYPINNKWAFQTGLMFTGKGYKVFDIKAKPHYLEIPLLAAFKVPISDNVNFVANAGPYLAFGLGGKTKTEDKGMLVSTNYFGEGKARRSDLGLQYGIGAEFNNILLNLTGQHGFISPFDDSYARNLAFTLTLGYRFRIH